MPKNLKTGQKELKSQLIAYLDGGHAHATMAEAVAGLDAEQVNLQPTGLPYTFWQVLEHIRITQRDIVDFVLSADYKSPPWPKGYWPAPKQKATLHMWNDAVRRVQGDLDELKNIVADPKVDVLKKIPHGTGQTILREVMLVVDHNSYHLGQLVAMRRAAGIWK